MSVSAVENSIPEASAAEPPAAGEIARERRPDQSWVWLVTALSGVLGVMLALAVSTTSRIQGTDQSVGRLGISEAFLALYKEQNLRLETEIKELRAQVDFYTRSASSDNRALAELKQRLAELRMRAGLSAAEGPGVRITVSDSPDLPDPDEDRLASMVHDQDLNNILAALKAAGARQIAIAGADEGNLQRVVVSTTARCVGPVAMVNETPLSAPYHIFAIGPPDGLEAALAQPAEGSYLHERQLAARKMIRIEKVEHLSLPEYAGTLRPRYAKPAGAAGSGD